MMYYAIVLFPWDRNATTFLSFAVANSSRGEAMAGIVFDSTSK
jgi:hypothetical protein